jgi:iron complex outermembrane receptor protein
MKGKNLNTIGAALATALMSATSSAQSLDYAALEALFGEPVTTSVTGSPQRSSDVPASMLIITADEIRRSAARDIPGVLSRLAGIDVRRSTSQHADVAVRGYNQAFSPRLLVLVDGRQVYADYFGFTPWSTVPIELGAIRQIEVVKGPSGALFGFNAVGGVVNIVTVDPLTDTQVPVVAVMAGTQNLRQASAVSTLHINDRAAVRISAGSRRGDEFSIPRSPADFDGTPENERNAVSVDAHFALGESSVLGLEATYSSADQTEFAPSQSLSYGQYETSSFRTHWQSDTRLGLVKANIYRNDIESDALLNEGQLPFKLANDVLVAQLEDVFKVGASHVVRVAGEYRDNRMQTTPIGGAQVSYEVLSLTSMWEWSVAPAVSITNAVRLDNWQLGRTGFVPPGSGVTNDDWNVSRDELSFNTGVVWNTPNAGTVRFSAGGARQLPNLFTLGGFAISFAPGVYSLGTPAVEPTNVTGFDMAWRHTLPASNLAVEFGAFRGRTNDLLTTFYGTLGSSETVGFEASVGGQVNDRVHWDVNLFTQDIDDDLSLPASITYTDFESTSPRRVLKGHLGWTRDRVEVDGFVRYESSSAGLRISDAFAGAEASLVPIPSHVTVDARLGYRFGERIRFALTGRNLTRSSQRQTAVSEVERQVYVSVEYDF